MRKGTTPNGMRLVKTDGNGGTLYAVNGDGNGNGSSHSHARPPIARTPDPTLATDWRATVERLRAKLTPDRLAALATATGVPVAAWAKLSPGWADADDLRTLKANGAGWADDYPTGAWAFVEHDGRGRIVGLSLRATDGRKGTPTGSKRGLIVPEGVTGKPVLVVEGASDCAACCALGLPAVGRPSNRGGAVDLADLLDGCDVLALGENDRKDGGAWPGRDGAKAVAAALAQRWGEPVRWALPPGETKDIRAWLQSRVAGGLDLADPEAAKVAGRELLDALTASAREAKAKQRSTADSLVDLATELYRLGMTDAGEAFAVKHDGPAVALMFRGGASALRATLAKEYRLRTGKTPNAGALADALVALEGVAMDVEPEPVALRVAEHDGGVVLDLGDAAGRAVVVTPAGWEVVDRSPVLFRRTALTAPMPEPTRGGDLALLRDLLNVTGETWALLVGWTVAAWMPNVPHAIALLSGLQGTGKSVTARTLVSIIDPSAAPLRSEPREAEQWAISAAGSWAVCIDNVSRIAAWFSDALCKAVTGDGWLRRKLYTDGDLAVLTFKRVVMLTSIDAGAMRGDLGDRLVMFDLEPIDETKRRTEHELDTLFTERRPAIFGALLDLLAATLAKMPDVNLPTLPRMADFARVLAAVDAVRCDGCDGSALDIYLRQRGRIADDVVEGDLAGSAIVRMIDECGSWHGTAGELLTALTPVNGKPPHGWPASARAMSGQLKRLIPALKSVGVEVGIPDTRSAGGRVMTIERGPNRPSQPSQQSFDHENTGFSSDGSGDGSDGTPGGNGQPSHRPSRITPDQSMLNGESDGSDGTNRPSFDDDPDDLGAFCSDFPEGDTCPF
ncbi:MAG: hypothetical protein GC164_00975 [Phycisphaera sp.]|nr:hypothetical protein [Phycisphaera sp.]